MNHPIFSPKMDDRFSLLLLRYSQSKAWYLFGFSALIIAAIAGIPAIDKSSFKHVLIETVAITYILSGFLLTWLAAQAHACKQQKKKWVIAIFIVWPLAYLYLMRHLFFNSNVNKNT